MNEQFTNLDYLYEVADNDLDFVREIINDYLSKVPGQFDELKKAVDGRDEPSAKFIAHKLKSSFQFMGVQQLVELSQQMESAAEASKEDVYTQCIGKMAPIIEAVLLELKQKLVVL
jgi:HPt (histidine-containing phosphotransfer) domain-containing protein